MFKMLKYSYTLVYQLENPFVFSAIVVDFENLIMARSHSHQITVYHFGLQSIEVVTYMYVLTS